MTIDKSPRTFLVFATLAVSIVSLTASPKWRQKVANVVERLVAALQPEYIVVGGGNAKELEHLPRRTRRGNDKGAFVGGFRLWETDTISDRSKGPGRRSAGR